MEISTFLMCIRLLFVQISFSSLFSFCFPPHDDRNQFQGATEFPSCLREHKHNWFHYFAFIPGLGFAIFINTLESHESHESRAAPQVINLLDCFCSVAFSGNLLGRSFVFMFLFRFFAITSEMDIKFGSFRGTLFAF